MTFENIKNDIEIDVEQSPGADDPRFSIIFGCHTFVNNEMNKEIVEVSICKSPIDNSYNASVRDPYHVLGEDFTPTREFVLYCISLLVARCSVHNAADDYIVEQARISDLKKLVKSGKITSIEEAKQFYPSIWDEYIQDIFDWKNYEEQLAHNPFIH